jgi:hypothetical protein
MSINFDPGVFAFLLMLTIFYFGITFALYYYVDIRNVEETTHEAQTREKTREAIELYISRAATALAKELGSTLPAEHRLSTSHETYEKIVKSVMQMGIRQALLFQLPISPAFFSVSQVSPPNSRNIILTSITHETNPEIFDAIAQTARRELRFFWLRVRINRLWHKRVSWGVKAAYLIRNYFVDGALPIVVAVFALLALYGKVDVHWIRIFAPNR